MKSRRLILLVSLSALALLVSGCQWVRWLRLLSFKKQLAHVERYVNMDDHDGLTLRFTKPVVYADDLRLLIADETLRITNRDRVTWQWRYEKQSLSNSNTEAGKFDLTFTMGFEKQKFCEMRFPQQFLTLMPRPLLLGLMRSAGQAEIDLRHGAIRMSWAGPGPNQTVELPTRSEMLRQLGPPFLVTETNGVKTFLYKYYQKMNSPGPPAERLGWGRFSVKGDGEEIASSEGVMGNVGWRMRRVPGEKEPRVTFALMDLTVEPVAIKLPGEITDAYVGQYQEPGGTILRLGRDGDGFVVSWFKDKTGGWCAALPETTNSFFGLPNGLPRGTFLHDQAGTVTGMLAQLSGPGTIFTKMTNPPPTGTVARLDTKAYAACAGRFKASWGGFVTLSCTGDQLFWQNQGVKVRVPLYPSSETNFFFKVVDSPLTFVKNAQGDVTKFILHFNGHDPEAVKVAGPNPTGDDRDPLDDKGT